MAFVDWEEPDYGKINRSFEEIPDKVPYGNICSCHPKNGGSGICGCIMGNKMVPNPEKYGQPQTNFATTITELVINIQEYQEDAENREAEEIIESNRKANILSSLIEVVMNDHPEFNEENTTGWDLVENAKIWLEEIKKSK